MIIRLYQRLDTEGGQLFTIETQANDSTEPHQFSYYARHYAFPDGPPKLITETVAATLVEAERDMLDLVWEGHAA
jgi:hypothetical protein